MVILSCLRSAQKPHPNRTAHTHLTLSRFGLDTKMPSGSLGPELQHFLLTPKHVLGEICSVSPTNILAPIQNISRQLQDPTMGSNTSEFVLRCREIQALLPLAVNLSLMEQHQVRTSQ